MCFCVNLTPVCVFVCLSASPMPLSHPRPRLSLSTCKKNPRDTGNFDVEFTSEAPRITPTAKGILEGIDQEAFADFTFKGTVDSPLSTETES